MKKGKKKPPEPDFKEVRPPLETNGMDFLEVMKRLSQTKPEEVKEAEGLEKEKSTSKQLDGPVE